MAPRLRWVGAIAVALLLAAILWLRGSDPGSPADAPQRRSSAPEVGRSIAGPQPEVEGAAASAEGSSPSDRALLVRAVDGSALEGGAPRGIAGVRVEGRHRSGAAAFRCTTGLDGSCRIIDPPPGTFTLSAELAGFLQDSAQRSATTSVQAGPDVHSVTLWLWPSTSLRGVVRSRVDRAPISGAEIRLKHPRSLSTTDRQGSFLIPEVPARFEEGRIELYVAHPEYKNQTVKVGSAAPLDIQLEPATHRFRGHVLLQGRPAAGARLVEVLYLAPRALGITTADGGFDVRTEAAEPAIRVEADGACPRELSLSESETDPRIQLSSCPMVRATVKRAEGGPPSGGTVEVKCPDRAPRQASLDERGIFSVAGAPAGTACTVSIRPQEEPSLEVSDDAFFGDKSYTLPSPATLRLSLRDQSSGLPVDSAAYTLSGACGSACPSAQVDSTSGVVELDQLAPGTYAVRIDARYFAVQVERGITLAPGEVRDLELALSPAGLIRGQLQLAPAIRHTQERCLRLVDASGVVAGICNVADDDSYYCDWVRPGRYRVTLYEAKAPPRREDELGLPMPAMQALSAPAEVEVPESPTSGLVITLAAP